MATVLTSTIVKNAKAAVDSYVDAANNLSTKLEEIITTLVSSNFKGDAADGYKFFYDNKVVPALTTNLTAKEKSLMSNVKAMLDSIEEQMLNKVDPELGNVNRNPGAEN